MDLFSGTLAALTAALIVAGPVSVAVTKVVDFIRNLIDANNAMPRFVWNIAAFVIGLGLCLGWGINVLAAVVNSIPALATNSMMAGTMGTVLTGLLVGAMAGFWHDKMKQWSAMGATADFEDRIVP
jgi:hypothetical protein